jgi:hypothetical protein
MKAVRAYFRDGQLPEKDTTCEVDVQLFDGAEKKQIKTMGSDDEMFFNAVKELGQNFEVAKAPHY